MEYGAVIFDLFGTLVDSASQETVRQSYLEPAAILGVDADRFMDAWMGIRPEKDVGKFGSLAGDVRRVCHLLGIEPEDDQVDQIVRQRLHIYRGALAPRATAIETMSTLKASGLKIGMISDCGWEIPEIWADTAFAPLVDTVLFSCREGAAKPDARLYSRTCGRLGVQTSRCLYVGDGGSRELTGALAAGMHPVLIRVGYERHLDIHRADAAGWTGRVISDISEILDLLTG